MARQSHKRRIGSGFQQVDQRLLMAGDVQVWMSSGDLRIEGNASSNRVDIAEVNGMLRVTGNYLYGNTTINGQSTPFEIDANLVDDVFIGMNGGNDRVFVNNVHLNNTSHGDLVIDTDGGNDMVGVYNTLARDIIVRTHGNDDQVVVAYSNATDDIDVELGSGNDELDLYAVSAGDRIEIDGDTGNDDVAIQYSSAANKLFADLDSGDDIMWINGGNYEDIEINGDKDDDRVTLYGVTVADDLDIELHDGYDQLSINNTTVGGSINLDGGPGVDKASGSGNNFDIMKLFK
ncbi:hypothetical protein [Rhodopirellula sp. MGV]|uniref:hypothetical protein n=1 Tax=Rhodopirellula sp. MGV TaxID=2023130 RepID=UPI000B963E49|nr:hypothetical protein [Rhodopirellula sp. MGV]OYP37908.1 hypothetical protein CGZ80_04060 [Rhodopirellula sp. MGV]PNY37085.1 hypothetical protein C2E31_09570 [Rhodopirellula baltica]